MTAPRGAFVLGCQRSGTTLLRFLLGAHRDVLGVDEEAAYPVLAGRRRLGDVLGAETAARLHIYKIPRFTEQLLEAEVRDETYGRCPRFYAGEPGVFVVRDPRDVVASMCTLRAGRDASWIAAYGRSMLEHRATHREAVAERYARELDELRRRDWPPHLTAALYWVLKNDALPAYLAASLPVLPVAYERLVDAAEPTLREVCRHLDLEWDERMLHHQDVDHDQLQPNGLAIGDSNPKRAIDRSSVGRYQGVLDADAVREVDAWTRERFDRLQQLAARP